MARPFPPGFLWGAATAAHQVEGDNRLNDWWRWEQQPGRIRGGGRSGEAARWWAGEAERDLERAAALGHNAHRMSLEWSRLEPEPGRLDEAAFARYAQILTAGRAAGLKMLVTLHHFTLPLWVAQRGGFADPAIAARLAGLARACLQRLDGQVDAWATLNEPSVLAAAAYATTRWPPGSGSVVAGLRALRNMLHAHAAASAVLRAGSAPVGLVVNMPLFEPARPGAPQDRGIARAQDWTFNGVVLRALEGGRLLPPLGAGQRAPGLAGSCDFIGLNYYGRYAVRFDPRAEGLGRNVQTPTVRTETNDWGQPCAAGLTRQLLRLARLGVPLYVTENGLYDNTDSRRPRYLVDHVHAVADAIDAGADVRGYFHWSLVDNFEWAEGWTTRFGLLALDRQTQRRTPVESARVYERICRANAAPDGAED
jgi:beta-glucosidase